MAMKLSKNAQLIELYQKAIPYKGKIWYFISYCIRFRSLKMHPDYDFSLKLGSADDDHIAVFRIARIDIDNALYYKAVLVGNYIRITQGAEVVKDLPIYCTMKDVFNTTFNHFIKTKYE